MGRHTLQQPHPLRHYGQGASTAAAILVAITGAMNLLPASGPRVTAIQAIQMPSYEKTSRFFAGMSRTRINVKDREPLVLRVAQRICGAADDKAATTDTAIASVAVLLDISPTQAVEFVVYSRGHCSDLA